MEGCKREKVIYKGSPIRLTADFSTETHHARREWHEVYRVRKSKGLNPRLFYPEKLSFKIEGEIRSFMDTHTKKLWEIGRAHV